MTDRIVPVVDLVGGKTVRQNNRARAHVHPLGAIVEINLDLSQSNNEEGIEINLKGKCRLYVVGYLRDCDGTPLYVVSDIPVKYPLDTTLFDSARMTYRFMAKIVEHGYGEDSLRPTGKRRDLHPSVNSWIEG